MISGLFEVMEDVPRDGIAGRGTFGAAELEEALEFSCSQEISASIALRLSLRRASSRRAVSLSSHSMRSQILLDNRFFSSLN